MEDYLDILARRQIKEKKKVHLDTIDPLQRSTLKDVWYTPAGEKPPWEAPKGVSQLAICDGEVTESSAAVDSFLEERTESILTHQAHGVLDEIASGSNRHSSEVSEQVRQRVDQLDADAGAHLRSSSRIGKFAVRGSSVDPASVDTGASGSRDTVQEQRKRRALEHAARLRAQSRTHSRRPILDQIVETTTNAIAMEIGLNPSAQLQEIRGMAASDDAPVSFPGSTSVPEVPATATAVEGTTVDGAGVAVPDTPPTQPSSPPAAVVPEIVAVPMEVEEPVPAPIGQYRHQCLSEVLNLMRKPMVLCHFLMMWQPC